jgi:ubiquinone/menaquinone biosynthesis C-methylase UbiE
MQTGHGADFQSSPRTPNLGAAEADTSKGENSPYPDRYSLDNETFAKSAAKYLWRDQGRWLFREVLYAETQVHLVSVVDLDVEMMSEKDQVSRRPVGTREWYDFIGQLAEVLPGIHMGGQEATQALLDMCQLDSESHVLDVGCGPGATSCFIAQQYGSRVQGIDISEVMITEAKERAGRQGLLDRVEFRVADVFQLPFEDNSFDAAIVESVLVPLPGDKKQALMEIMRVIRPGGRIGVNESTVDPSAPPEYLALLDEHPAIYGYFTPQTLRSLIEESGLQVVHMTEAEHVETPSPVKEMGFRGLLSFIFRAYPKIVLKLLRDARFRKATRIDDQITKRGKSYMGYCLIVGQKPG